MAYLVLVLLIGMARIDVLGEMVAFEDVDFGTRDSAAVDLLGLERCINVECGSCLLEYVQGDAGVNEGSEEHVACNTGEAV
jgi:hypothetical protein